MKTRQRPLSPHLQVYRLQITSVLSILHRLTGIALAAGTALLVWWLVSIALGPKIFGMTKALIASWPGRVVLFGWVFALFFHLANGIRHLAWDAGWGFDLKTAETTGWIVVGAAFALTLLAFAAGYAAR